MEAIEVWSSHGEGIIFASSRKGKTSPDRGRTPSFLRMSPIDPGQEITELCRRDRYGAVGLARPQEATALQPYFDRNPFRNVNRGQCPCFWWWSMKMPFHPARTWLVRRHPVAIVYGDKWPGHQRPLHRWELPGYHVARHFEGALYIRNQIFEHEGFWVLVPDGPASP